MQIRALRGSDILCALDDVARLRMTVFAEWPYLYDGDLSYEKDYLRPYAQSAGAIVIAAYEGDRLVGASTGSPLQDHADDFAAAFATASVELSQVFYCAESVLLQDFRGRGIGRTFFDLREAHARSLGFTYSAFCGVIRPNDHPARPAAYRPLDPFWRACGYRPLTGVIAKFKWKDIGDTSETAKPLQFWMKDL